MSSNELPTILIIDDHAEDEQAKFRFAETEVKPIFRHPRDVDEVDLRHADVVLIDYVLDDWSDREEAAAISLRPLDGLALAAVLRGHAEKCAENPTAFVLRSAHLEQLSQGYPLETRLHIIARQHNLEWVLDKNNDAGQQMAQMVGLSAAVRSLPDEWPADDADATRQIVERWLALPENRWRDLAWQDIEDCHPPWHQLVERKHGLRLVRWLAQRILPYPCFLWTSDRLAARLRVTRESLREGLSKGLDEIFEPARYTGSLDDFLGERWWQSGCEAVLWDITGGSSFDIDQVLAVLNQACSGVLERSGQSEPVLCVDAKFHIGGETCEMADAVRIQPDDWPPYAEQAWTSIQLAHEDARLRAAVIAMDRQRLSEPDDVESEVD